MLSLWKLHRAATKPIFSTSAYFFSTHNYDSDNPYVVLGVKATDSDMHIKAVFRTLSKKYHPDVNKDPNAADILKKINNAYDKIKTGSHKYGSHYQHTHTHRPPHSNAGNQEWRSTNYGDTDWSEAFRKQHQKEKTSQEQKTQEKQKTEYTKKESKEEAKAEQEFYSKTGETDEYAGMTDEDIYFRIFRKTYKEDPTFYFKPENAHLRRKYEEILEKRKGPGDDTSRKSRYHTDYAYSKTYTDDTKGYEKQDSPQEEEGMNPYVLPAVGVAVVALAVYLYIRSKSNDSATSIDPQHQPGSSIEVEKIRQIALKAEEEKKKRMKDAYLGNMALMKKYPRVNPDATSMLVDYTIWNDLKLYSIHPDYYYQHADTTLGRKYFKPSPIFNLRLNTKLNLALEAERVLKNVYVPIKDVLDELKEKGIYEPPVVNMRFWGFIMIKIRRKPIIAENLLQGMNRKEDYISLFDLFFRYSTPILLANYDDYVFPIKGHRFIPDTTTREGMAWLGFVTLNHRPLPRKVVGKNDKHIFMWQSKSERDPSERDYIGYWINFYENMKHVQH